MREGAVFPGSGGSAEEGEVLHQRASAAVERESVEEVSVDDAGSRNEARVTPEVVLDARQCVIESPRTSGAVELRVPQRRRASAERGTIVGPRSSGLTLEVIQAAEDVADVGGGDSLEGATVPTVGDARADEGAATEIGAGTCDVEERIASTRLIERREIRDAVASNLARDFDAAERLGDLTRVDQLVPRERTDAFRG